MAEVFEDFEWWTFVCAACGNEASAGKQRHLSDAEFAGVMRMLYGDPPVCTSCKQEERRP